MGAHPVHLTMRVAKGLPSFRRKDLFAVVRDALVATRGDFRVLEFSVQENHLHLIVEAGTRRSLMAGAKGLAVRIAQVINKALGRSGQVWGDRYHTHEVRNPHEHRNALVYVLMNARKHHRSTPRLDPCSSAPWFEGFRDHAPTTPSPLPRPRTWLASQGWRGHGLLSTTETPRSGPRPPAAQT